MRPSTFAASALAVITRTTRQQPGERRCATRRTPCAACPRAARRSAPAHRRRARRRGSSCGHRGTSSTRRRAGRAGRSRRAAATSRSAARPDRSWRRRSVSPTCGSGSPSPAASVSTSSWVPTSTSSRRRSSAVAIGPIGTSTRGVHAAGVEALLDRHHAHAGDVVAGEQRSLDGRRAPPAREQREVQVDHAQLGEHVRLDDPPEGDDDAQLGAGRRARRRPTCDTGRPSRSAAAFTGLGDSSLPRPRRLSAPVTTSAMSCPAATSASSGGTAIAGVPR